MTAKRKADVILEQLEQVQARIMENERLQKEYPNKKRGLLITLNTLKHLEKDMLNALKDEYVSNNAEVYEIYLKGKNVRKNGILLEDLGEVCIEQQNTTTTFSLMEPLSKNAIIPPEIQLNSQLYVRATGGGSFRIIVTTSQKVLCDVNDAETPVKHAFHDLKKVIDCGTDKELLKSQEALLGSKKILAYRNLLKVLSEKEMDIEISTRLNDKTDMPIINIKTEDAKKVYPLLIEKNKAQENEIVVSGVLRRVDFDTRKFKLVVKVGNKSRNIFGSFDANLEDIVAKYTNKEANLNLRRITKRKSIGKTKSFEHILLNFIED